MRYKIMLMSMAIVASSGVGLAADKQPQPTDPLSSSRAPDSKPTTGHSTFDAPDKPPGPWGEIPGGGGPSGYNDGAAQKAPQFEGEKFKTAEQSQRDAMSKPGGKDAPDSRQSASQDQAQQSQSGSSQQSQSGSDAAKAAGREQHHQMVSPAHLGPQGGSTADSGKETHDERARAEQEASKPQGSF